MTGATENDSADFIDQARWLLEWHNRRSEAFTTRAVAVLAFVGVVLALLLQGAGLPGITASCWTWSFLVGLLIALTVSGLFAVLTIAPMPNAAPSVQQLRNWWKEHMAEPNPGTSRPNFAESLLNGGHLGNVSALSSAKFDADQRGSRFKVAIAFMVISLIFLASLVSNILMQAWGK